MADNDSRVKISERIGKFVEDVASLDVLTLTGKSELSANPARVDPPQGGQGKKLGFSWDGLFEKVVAGMDPASANKLSVLAYTHAEFDSDAVIFVQEGLSPENRELLAAHHAAVEAAQKSRIEAVRVVTDLLGGVVKPGAK